ncbi:Sugar kinase of the NBD/HSP70 family, may contain an N-terminal HTH domain [Paenibacillus sp. 1_12]|uniref:ROK family protein n=1 Tax=Paenibacillus sp. 1_12 TaxID=1566278 RepID=UPI0008E34464|nr:ROK family protein [Paenibacillus sp. 1_12]SFM22351.1 Sugar kinase of the NBD/HSP70 family, may contain an N-terminal HTH domain [Paenibacillus sp. 1_12]
MQPKGPIGNHDLVKKINMEHIISTILQYRPVSRAKIASLTGLNKMTVSSCIDLLLQKAIVVELGTTGTSRGRPPILVDINELAGICVGVDVEVNQYTVLITDLLGKKLESMVFPLESKDPHYFVDSISRILADLEHTHAQRQLGIVGAGIVIQGYYNIQTNVVEYSANLKEWNSFPLMEELTKRNPNLAIYINPAPYAGAMGEVHFGRSKSVDHLVYVTSSWGMSVGVYNKGELFTGSTGTAGRLGHSTIHMNGKKCTCGSRGCWEMYASIKALYELLEETPQQLSFADIVAGIHSGESKITSAVHELGHYHGIGLANVINAYNPKVICIGGHLALLGSTFINSIWNTLNEVIPERFLKNLDIYCSDLGELGVAHGGVSMVISQLSNTIIRYSLLDSFRDHPVV